MAPAKIQTIHLYFTGLRKVFKAIALCIQHAADISPRSVRVCFVLVNHKEVQWHAFMLCGSWPLYVISFRGDICWKNMQSFSFVLDTSLSDKTIHSLYEISLINTHIIHIHIVLVVYTHVLVCMHVEARGQLQALFLLCCLYTFLFLSVYLSIYLLRQSY